MSRPTLLLIHGFPHDSTLWTPQIEGLRDVADVIAPDLRGFGSNTDVPEKMRMEDYAAELKALLDKEHTGRVVVCGLSMGGYVAMAFMEAWPNKVQGLILSNTRATADTPEARQGRMDTAANAINKGVPVIARGMVTKLLSSHTQRERPDLVKWLEAMMARQPAEGVAAASRGMAERPDRTEFLSKIKVPTLIITGSEDELMPFPTSQAMAERIPQSELVVIRGAAHLPNLEAPVQFNTLVRVFLRSLV
jgi:3-oxoadipate enol-lactonase